MIIITRIVKKPQDSHQDNQDSHQDGQKNHQDCHMDENRPKLLGDNIPKCKKYVLSENITIFIMWVTISQWAVVVSTLTMGRTRSIYYLRTPPTATLNHHHHYHDNDHCHHIIITNIIFGPIYYSWTPPTASSIA